MKRALSLAMFLVLTVAGFAAPQPKLVAVHLTGSKHYSEQDVLAASGLKIGTPVTPADFQNAANTLGETGVFTSVGFKYTPKGAGYVVTFEVEEANFLPVRFENFVWFSDEELLNTLRERAPMFRGEVATSGPMMGAVADALNSVLSSRSLPGRVYYRMHTPSEGAPIDSVSYVISDVPMAVVEVRFTGATHLNEADQEAASKLVLDQNYEASVTHDIVSDAAERILQHKGYLRARIGVPERKLLGDDPATPEVSLTFPVTEGLQYRIKSFEWEGNSTVPKQELNSALSLAPGAIADGVTLSDDLDKAVKVCASHGFLGAGIESTPSFDDAAQTVRYKLLVKEGPLYRMGIVQFENLDKSVANQLQQKWKLKVGDPFDASYAQRFLNESGVGRVGQRIRIKQHIAPGNVVNLVIEF